MQTTNEVISVEESAEEYRRKIVAAVCCPVCHSEKGEPCTMTKGRSHQVGGPRKPHKSRHELFKFRGRLLG